MKHFGFLSILIFLFILNASGQNSGQRGDLLIANFEDLPLDPESYWNGSDLSGGFTSGPAFFRNSYDEAFGSWSGFSYSNMANDSIPGFLNQYSAITAEGFDPVASGGVNYAVAYVSTDWITAEQIPIVLDVTGKSAGNVQGFYVTNSTWAALAMENGDEFTKKFGGETGDDPDYFKLYTWGYADGLPTDTVGFYLADYRFPDNGNDYIVNTWEWVDLSSLGPVDSLKFMMESTDTGQFGINTPTYFCLDDLTFTAMSHYISEVLEYKPAPGQLINTVPWGVPSSANSITGGVNGTLSLGAFGGYVVFQFEGPVENHPDNPYGVDFTIFGNAYQDWSEPGIVSVMKDENGNGLPDDTWYELAGSDYRFTSTVSGYEVTYTNPGASGENVPWADNLGNEGVIHTTSTHTQPYYPQPDSFPGIPAGSYLLSGTRIIPTIDSSGAIIRSFRRSFGYADNTAKISGQPTIPDNPYTTEIENSGGDAFDISWAVDPGGNYVDLDRIHFVKVHNGVLANAGYLGELSTEIRGAVDVPPDASVNGQMQTVVIRDLPPLIKTSTYQMEVLAFEAGRVNHDAEILWMTSKPEASVSDGHLLTVTESGELELTAYLTEDPTISETVSVVVELSSSVNDPVIESPEPGIFPNPSTNSIIIRNVTECSVIILNTSGQVMYRNDKYSRKDIIDVSSFPVGIYFVRFMAANGFSTLKLIRI